MLPILRASMPARSLRWFCQRMRRAGRLSLPWHQVPTIVLAACIGAFLLVQPAAGAADLAAGQHTFQPIQTPHDHRAAVAASAHAASPTGGGETGACGESLDNWHPPALDGCATGHEHGDEPPEWTVQP